MADDKPFRPQKRSIQPSELSEKSTPAENLNNLEAMARMREAMRQETEHEEVDMVEEEEEYRPLPPNIPANMPPGLRAAFEKRGIGVKGQSAPPSKPAMKSRQQQGYDPQFQVVERGNEKLQEILNTIREVSFKFEEVHLPSGGKFYDGENGPMDGIIHLKPMTGQEEQILATPRFVKKGDAVNMIFQNCMRESYNVDKFLVQDRTYMLIYLRIISYSPMYEVEIKCPFTDTKFPYTLDLNELNVDNCPASFGPENLTGVLPRTGLSFQYKLATGMEEKMLNAYQTRKMKEFDTGNQADDSLTYRTMILLENIAGLSSDIEKRQILENLPMEDVAFLRNTVNTPPFGVDTKLEVISPANQESFVLDVPLESNFFFPRARKATQTTP